MLTDDDEIINAITNAQAGHTVRGTLLSIGRAVEQSVLGKLGIQPPARCQHVRNCRSPLICGAAGKCAKVTDGVPVVSEPRPLDMVLHCPNCGMQHIDGPEETADGFKGDDEPDWRTTWTNPPHRSHLCHKCGTIWRPADVPTNGVRAILTKGKADTWPDGVEGTPK